MNEDQPNPGGKGPDDLVTFQLVGSEFEAGAIVASLREAGIEAVAFGSATALWPMTGQILVPIQVRRDDLDRAKAALEKTIADSVDLDWDEVDVGQREDQTPLREPGRMPMISRGGQIAAIILVVALLLLALWVLGALPWR